LLCKKESVSSEKQVRASMVVQLHGFDWAAYTEHIMPAFGAWFVQREESTIYRLFKETRCAREEEFVPDVLLPARIWTRARVFVETLPLGPYSRREYQRLCSAEQFTALSDRYVYKHVPQLYHNPEAVRAIWGALIETHCLPWSQEDYKQLDEQKADVQQEDAAPLSEDQVERSEVLTLLHEAGLSELACEISEEVRSSTEHLRERAGVSGPDTQPLSAEHMTAWQMHGIAPAHSEEISAELEESEEEIEVNTRPVPGGVPIGVPSNVLQLRGWLAGFSVRALALFEYLACGRRCMPFGYEPSEAYGIFIGYLTPNEVWHLGTSLRGVQHPGQAEAEADYLRFRYQHPSVPESYRLLDEVLPVYSADFHHAIDMAAAQGLGLICSVE
jgi:hypothetical protein